MFGFGKKKGKHGKYDLEFSDDPAQMDVKELAVVLGMVADLDMLCTKLGVDVTKIITRFEFTDTKHQMGFRLTLAKKR